MKFVAIILMSLAILGGCAQQGGTQAATTETREQAGTALVDLSGGATPGETSFNQQCAVCHASGKMYPGYRQLQVRGSMPAALRDRTDLDKDYVVQVVRNGLGSMPAFTPTQVSDAELEEIATWLASKK